jgi:CBS-domain-containing membrane protein
MGLMSIIVAKGGLPVLAAPIAVSLAICTMQVQGYCASLWKMNCLKTSPSIYYTKVTRTLHPPAAATALIAALATPEIAQLG